MKRNALLAAVLTVAATSLAYTTPVLAQTRKAAQSAAPAAAGPSEWALDGSIGFAAPSYGNASLGLDLMGAVEWHPRSTLPVAWRGEIGWSHFGYTDGNSDIVRFDVDALYDIPVHWTSKLQPYILGGLGIYHVSVSVDCSALGVECASDSDTNLGINLGGGLRYPIGPVLGFFELRWHEAFTAGDVGYFPFQFGVKYNLK